MRSFIKQPLRKLDELVLPAVMYPKCSMRYNSRAVVIKLRWAFEFATELAKPCSRLVQYSLGS